MAPVKHFGDPQTLRFAVEWDGPPTGDAERRTQGKATLEVGSRYVWGRRDRGFDWTWIELLEFLSEAWRFLVWEQTYPEDLQPRTPLLLEESFEESRQELSQKAGALLHEEVVSFLEHHDLACALHGATAAPVRLLRMGDLCSVTTQGTDLELRFAEVVGVLAAIGEEIVGRLNGAEDPRSICAVQAWLDRENVDEEFVLQFGIQLPRSHWATLRRRLSDGPASWERDELFAAARLAGGSLSVDSFEHLLTQIDSVPLASTPVLDSVTTEARSELKADSRAYREGYELARALRRRLGGVEARECIDVEAVVRRLGVTIRDVDLDTPELDAVAVFGPRRGPAILVNTSGYHAQGPRGRRATLAHELCHLLVDRDGALPVVEVLGGKSPRRPEQRANAFAAELLVPGEEALRATRDPQPETRDEWEKQVFALSSRFGASIVVAAWQTINANDEAGAGLSNPARGWLRALTRGSADAVRDPTESKRPSEEALAGLSLHRSRPELHDPETLQRVLMRDAELTQLLGEALDQTTTAFGDAALLRIEPFIDPEAEQTAPRAYLVIRTRLSVAEAEDKLDALDEGWWLDNSHRASGLLSIALDYL